MIRISRRLKSIFVPWLDFTGMILFPFFGFFFHLEFGTGTDSAGDLFCEVNYDFAVGFGGKEVFPLVEDRRFFGSADESDFSMFDIIICTVAEGFFVTGFIFAEDFDIFVSGNMFEFKFIVEPDTFGSFAFGSRRENGS